MAEGHTSLRTHDLSSEHLHLDLNAALAELGTSASDGGRQTVPLIRQAGLSVMLIHLPSGGLMAEHSAPGPITIHVVDGNVRVTAGDERMEASRGHLVALDTKVPHTVEALGDSTFVLTIATPAT